MKSLAKPEIVNSLTDDELITIKYDWPIWARKEQLPPEGDWQFWSYIGGRGAGKTRTGAEFTRMLVNDGYKNIALVAPTHDAFDKIMVNGESGILACSPHWNRPAYNESKKTLTWPNGAQAVGYSAETPDRLRGPNHDAAWCDELAAWHPNRRQKTWDMLMMTLRSGDNPKCMSSTTPLPVDIIRDLMQNAINGEPGYVLTKSSTYANAKNLSKQFLDSVVKKYKNTRLGQQELLGELLLDIPGALWNMDMINPYRADCLPKNIKKLVVAIDPSGAYDKTTGGNSARERENAASQAKNDEIGIVVAAEDYNEEYYVIQDLSLLAGPDKWSQVAVDAYHDYGADTIIAETNFGGGMVVNTIKRQDRNVRVKTVTASRGKAVRAAPIAMLYEQGRVHHVGRADKFVNNSKFIKLEEQLCKFTASEYTGTDSPDRADAMIWALSELSGQTGGRFTTGVGTS